MKAIRLNGHTANIEGPSGPLGMAHAVFIRDDDGKEIGNISISRLNYRTDAGLRGGTQEVPAVRHLQRQGEVMTVKPKTIKQVAEERAVFRKTCRERADAIMTLVLNELDAAPVEQQSPILSMLQSELQIAARQTNQANKESTRGEVE